MVSPNNSQNLSQLYINAYIINLPYISGQTRIRNCRIGQVGKVHDAEKYVESGSDEK